MAIFVHVQGEKCPRKYKSWNYSHLSNKHDVTLTGFGKFPPFQTKNPHCTFIDWMTKLSIFLQNIMTIFLTVNLSY